VDSDLISDALKKLSADIQMEIDHDILTQQLVDNGWIFVEFTPFISNKQAVDIVNWVESNAQGKYYNWSTKYVFERLEDASLAILKWK
jgi:hypothetical protein